MEGLFACAHRRSHIKTCPHTDNDPACSARQAERWLTACSLLHWNTTYCHKHAVCAYQGVSGCCSSLIDVPELPNDMQACPPFPGTSGTTMTSTRFHFQLQGVMKASCIFYAMLNTSFSLHICRDALACNIQAWQCTVDIPCDRPWLLCSCTYNTQ